MVRGVIAQCMPATGPSSMTRFVAGQYVGSDPLQTMQLQLQTASRGRVSPITHLHPCATPCTPQPLPPRAKDCPPHTPPLPSSAGTFVYRTSPEPLTRVLRRRDPPRPARQRLAPRQLCTWALRAAGQYGAHQPAVQRQSGHSELRARLTLRSTVRGANNRLAVDSFFSWDGVREGSSHSLLEEGEAGEGLAGPAAVPEGAQPFCVCVVPAGAQEPPEPPSHPDGLLIPG